MYIYIYESKELRKQVICSGLEGKPVNMHLNGILPKSQSGVSNPSFLPRKHIKEIP